MSLRVEISKDLSGLRVGVVEILGVEVAPVCTALQAYCSQVITQVRSDCEGKDWESQCQEVRQMLRHGKFKASGRSKPAQEYLLRCATTDNALPDINGPVNLLNAVSLSCNLPISLLSIAKCSTDLFVDRGKPGESFVFNTAGHEIDLTDLITVYDRSSDPMRPVGTPIKDSMAGKIEPQDHDLVAIVYSPHNNSAMQRCERAIQLLSNGMREFCDAKSTTIVSPQI